MSAVVLAAVLVFPTGIAPQPEPLSTAWWLLRPAWLLLCGVCLLLFLFAFRWAERPVAAAIGGVGAATGIVGVVAAAVGLAVLAREAFPVQGEVILWPAVGVGLVVLGALVLRVDPIAPLRSQPQVMTR
jgi:peptidoglycan/LPS O-acetylase OafA/YrhL